MATLTHVAREWRNRPAHERFYDVEDIIPILEREQRLQRSIVASMDTMTIESNDDEFFLEIPGVPTSVRLNNWSFQRFSDQINVDASFCRKQPAELMAPVLQYQLRNNAGTSRLRDMNKDGTIDDVDEEAEKLYGAIARPVADAQARQLNILMAPDKDGGLFARDVASSSYGRYSNLEIAKDALLARDRGWMTPRAISVNHNPYPTGHLQADRVATAEDEMACSLIQEGMKIGPAGVYLGDRNIFIFLASDVEVLPGHYRFVTLENSEVGESRKLRATFGLFNKVCYNHLLLGVSNVHRVEKKHRRGSVMEFHDEFAESLDLISRSDGVPESLYHTAKQKMLGNNTEEVSDSVYEFGKKKQILSLTRRTINAAIECAQQNPGDADGASPFSVWGFVQGATRYSQALPYADKRHAIDVAAGSLFDEFVKEDDGAKSASVPATIDPEGVVKPVRKSKKS